MGSLSITRKSENHFGKEDVLIKCCIRKSEKIASIIIFVFSVFSVIACAPLERVTTDSIILGSGKFLVVKHNGVRLFSIVSIMLLSKQAKSLAAYLLVKRNAR